MLMEDNIYKKIIQEFGSPVYVYQANKIDQKIKQLRDAAPDFHISYAMKANSNEQLLKYLHKQGIQSIDVVSPGQIHKALRSNFQQKNIIYTQNFISSDQIDYALKIGVILNIGALSTLQYFKNKLTSKEIFIRINPDLGAGQHYKVITGGPQSKFGIIQSDINQVIKLCKQNNIKIIGIHQHIGSNLKYHNQQVYLKTIKYIFEISKRFQNLKYINIGGGFGVKYKPQEKLFNLKLLFNQVRQIKKQYQDKSNNHIQIIIQPGRFIIAESGKLLCKITAKKKTSERIFYGTDTGFNHLIRPALYGSYHQVTNISNQNHEKEIVTVCGNICQSTDNLAVNVPLGGEIGDILAFHNAGAYGFVMSSNFNQRLRPPQVLIQENGQYRLIRRRQTYEDLIDKI